MSDLATLLASAIALLDGPHAFLGLYRRELAGGRVEYEVRIRAWSDRSDSGSVVESDRVRRVEATGATLEDALRKALAL